MKLAADILRKPQKTNRRQPRAHNPLNQKSRKWGVSGVVWKLPALQRVAGSIPAAPTSEVVGWWRCRLGDVAGSRLGGVGWLVRGLARPSYADGFDEGEVAVEVNLGGPGLKEGGVAAGAELVA